MKIKITQCLCILTTLSFSSSSYSGSKYINLQIRTGNTGFVESVHIDTNLNNSLSAGDIKLTNSITTILKNVGLFNDTQQAMPNAWFKITAQSGLIFDYVTTTNYAASIGRITDPELQQKVQNANIAFQKYLNTIDRSLGLNITADLPGDVMLKNNPYSAPARAMYKEMRKLAYEVGILLPDPDAESIFCRRNMILGGLAATALASVFLYSYWYNTSLSYAFGRHTEQCGIGIETVGTGISKGGTFFESIGRGVQKFGTWIKTPVASKTITTSTANASAAVTTTQKPAVIAPATTPAPEVTAPPVATTPTPTPVAPGSHLTQTPSTTLPK